MGSGAPSLHNRREVSQQTAWSNVQIEHTVNNTSTVQCIYSRRYVISLLLGALCLAMNQIVGLCCNL